MAVERAEVNPDEVHEEQEAAKEETMEVPEKFRNEDGSVNQEALIQSYVELEKKINGAEEEEDGTPSEDENTEGSDTTEDDKDEDNSDNEEEEESSNPGDVMQELTESYRENNELTDEQYEKAQEALGVSREQVDAYIEGMQATATQFESELLEEAGGEERWQNAVKWAETNLSDDEKSEIHSALAGVDPMDNDARKTAKEAVTKLMDRYSREVGTQGKRVKGKSSNSKSGPEPFKTMDEAKKFASDPKMHKSDEYRREYERRLAASDHLFQ